MPKLRSANPPIAPLNLTLLPVTVRAIYLGLSSGLAQDGLFDPAQRQAAKDLITYLDARYPDLTGRKDAAHQKELVHAAG